MISMQLFLEKNGVVLISFHGYSGVGIMPRHCKMDSNVLDFSDDKGLLGYFIYIITEDAEN